MESYFNELDIIQSSSIPKVLIPDTCCSNLENWAISEEKTLCRCCNEEITILSNSPEKVYEGGKNTSRTGMPTSELLPDSTTGSVICPNFIQNSSMRNIARLNSYNGIPYKTRSLLIVFNTISSNCNRHNVSKKIINESQGIYKIISKFKISRGSNRSGIIAACIFLAAKNCAAARSSAEIAKIMNIEKKVVTKGIKQLNDIIRVNRIPLDRINHDRVTAIDLIDRICYTIPEISEDHISEIKLLCGYCNENFSKELSSCTPPSLAASIINFYVLGNKLSVDKNIISDKATVSVVTIQKITNILQLLGV
jgi:transcription initiation factor TFIIIB Brf1 subunit/transcription initiation factor TFIIB